MDAILLGFCAWAALLLGRHDVVEALWVLVGAPLLAIPVFVRFGLYRAVLKYIEARAFYTVLKAVVLHSGMLAAAMIMLEQPLFPFLGIYVLGSLVLIGGSRVLLRSLVRWWEQAELKPAIVAIFGAGSAGVQLAEMLKHSREYEPVAFLDDKRELHGREIAGLAVFSTAKLGELIRERGITQVLLAIPSVSQARRSEITRLLESYRVHVKTVPTLQEIVAHKSKLRDLRELELDDLLDRPAVAPDQRLLERCVAGKCVMVTGAGGSIGSELCRQILKHRPRQIILFERSEYALYSIEREIKALVKSISGVVDNIEVIPLLGSVTDERHLKLVMTSFGVQTLYHAAAYKHVPMVEHNPIQGVLNNVFGTLYCARAANEAKVETFTLISTDKAVRPKNVMGATKRLAELIVQSFAARHEGTRYVTVRFGNVLGSSGSVVPLFRDQIKKGGPVTITHRDVTRYFMSIPEAAQLVIQASAMGADGDVFVLEMGEPVRIIDLARRMIALSGLVERTEEYPEGDISIEVTSLRPGEKLHEELIIGGAVQKTDHPQIMRVKEESVPWSRLERVLMELGKACAEFDSKRACDELQAITGYQQQTVVDFLWERRMIAMAAGTHRMLAPVSRAK
jgi:FlaA1/EpsC-like NDP-sugar epimerase